MIPTALFQAIVRRFSSDDYVMNVRLAETCRSDAHEATLLAQFLQRAGANVAHTAFESADQLVAQRAERAFVRDAAFHTLWHGLAALGCLLHHAVAIGAGGP